MSSPTLTLETIIIFSRQMEKLARFYEEGLDLPPFQPAPGHLGQQIGHIYLGIDQTDSAQPQVEGGLSVWFLVDDIQTTFDRLLSLGAQVRRPPQRTSWGVLLASVYDPDGNILGLSQRI